MKRTLTILAVMMITLTTQAQKKYSKLAKEVAYKTDSALVKSNADTLNVASEVKFIRIGEKMFSVSAFATNEPVFLPLQYWQALVEMLRNATGVNLKPEEMIAIIQAVVQQLPKQQAKP
jgi:hypothetical protein